MSAPTVAQPVEPSADASSPNFVNVPVALYDKLNEVADSTDAIKLSILYAAPVAGVGAPDPFTENE